MNYRKWNSSTKGRSRLVACVPEHLKRKVPFVSSGLEHRLQTWSKSIFDLTVAKKILAASTKFCTVAFNVIVSNCRYGIFMYISFGKKPYLYKFSAAQ